MDFIGNELHKAAKRSAPYWEKRYTSSEFVQLVVELGIVGRVRTKDPTLEFLEADFEFLAPDRLQLNENHHCVIHPLFYRRLNVYPNNNHTRCVFPFPDSYDSDIFRDIM